MKYTWKRFLSFMLALLMVISAVPFQALAVEYLKTTVLDGKIAVTSDGVSGQGTGVVNNDGTITVTSKATAGCSGMSYSYTANEHKIYVTNNTTDETLMVEFAYEASGLGTLTIDDATKTSTPKGTYSKSLAPGEKITIVITSPASGSDGNGDTATIVLSNFELKDTSAKNVTVVKMNGGTTTVNGTTLTAESITVSTDYATGVAVKATPASGYVFLGWVDSNGNVLSTLSTDTIHPLAEMTVAAAFVKNDTQGYWLAGGTLHTDLNEAITAAQSGDKKVVLLKSGTLSAGTYTIPADVYVLIPFDEALTSYGAEPELMPNSTKWVNPTPYVTLTMAAGATLNVNGALELAAKHYVSTGASGYQFGGAIYKSFGHINMASDSAINVNNGGNLYAWGIVSGDGVVNANSGATVYEKMQIHDYRGGTITSTLATTYSGRKVFPFSQYYVQNVEVQEVIHSGATLMINAGVFLSSPEQASVAFVGSNDAMFTLGSGSYAVKSYNATEDRLKVDVYGNASLSSIALSFEGNAVNSESFRLGINNNIDIHVHSGVATVKQEMVLQPGATVTIDRGATLYNTTNLYVMDAEDWGTYCYGKTYIPIKWTYPNGTTVKRTGITEDAILDINGIVINAGQIYTSGSQSVISSEKTGVYALLSPASSSGSIYQVTSNDGTGILLGQDWTTIQFTAAVLVHGDGTTLTAEGGQYDAFIYDSFLDKWVQKNIYNGGAGYTATLTYDANGGEGTATNTAMDYFTQAAAFMGSNYTVMAPYSFAVASGSALSREGYTFAGWSTDPNATAAEWKAGDYVTISADTTLYAVWTPMNFALYVDGEQMGDAYVGDDLTDFLDAFAEKDGFTWKGWKFYSDAAHTQEVTLTDKKMPAHNLYVVGDWEKNVVKYTLTFLDENGDVLKDADGNELVYTYAEGETVTATYPEYKKDNYTITWSATIPTTLTEDVEISAIANANIYTIHFYDGTTDLGEATAEKKNNWTATIMDNPTKDADENGHYTFAGWSTDKNATTADSKYTAGAEVALTGDLTLYAVYTTNAHQWTGTIKMDTNGENGTHSRLCALGCGRYGGAVAHTWNDGVVNPAPDCLVGGVKTYTCTAEGCGATYTETLNANGHSFGATVAFNDATCQAEGNYAYKQCTACKLYFAADAATNSTDGKADAFAFVIAEKDHSTNYTYTPNDDGKTHTIHYTCHVGTAGTADHEYEGGECICKAIQTFTVTWANENGETLYTETVKYGEDAPGKDVPAKTGYTGKWDKDGKNITADTTITAVYTVNTYTLRINLGNGTIDGNNWYEVVAEYDVDLDIPAITPPEGYVLDGWTVEIDGEQRNAEALPTTMPAADRTYVAVWKLKTVTIDFDANGGNKVEAYTGDYFSTYAAPTATREGYTFLGWDDNTNANDTEVLYAAGAEITLNSSVEGKTLYAKWQVNTYNVNYYVDGKLVHTASVEYGEAIPSYTYDPGVGCTFSGWGEIPETMPAHDVRFEGNTGVAYYMITWLNEDGTLIYSISVPYGSTPTGPELSKKATEEYTYTLGWTPKITAVTGNATYTAVFTAQLRQYDITFVVDGQEDKVVSTNYGEIPVVEDPSKATDAYNSYEFKGWAAEADGTVLESLPVVTGTATYYAVFEASPVEHTITFKIDGETFHVETGYYDTEVDYTDMPSTDKTGYTFNGWDKDLPETFPAEDITITGSYTINRYTITFKGDFNTELDDAFAGYTITKNYGEAITEADIAALEATLPTITGWKFLGWYYAEEVKYEEAEEPVWKHTDEYQIPATMGAADVTVYAKWEEIIYVLNVLSSIDNQCIISAYMLYEEYYQTLEEFNRINAFCYDGSCVDEDHHVHLLPAGYTFAGYKYENGTDVTFPYSQPAEDVTIIAQFKPIDYIITFMSEGDEFGVITAAYGSDITDQVADMTATKEGYTFAGWVDAEGNAVTLTTMPLNGMIVYASWTIGTFNVNFYATEGDATAVKSIAVEYGTELTKEFVDGLLAQVTDPSKEGHTWKGWNTSSVPETMPAKAVNVYGTWAVNEYIMYFKNPLNPYGNFSALMMYQETYDDMEDFLDGNFNNGEEELKVEGYTFTGFKYEDGTNVTFPFVQPAHHITIIAQYEINSYTITFDVEGIAPITADYGAEINWPEDPTKTGHTFLGWDSNDDGVADTLPETMPVDGLNLKAVWQKNTVYITWIIDGVNTDESYSYGDSITAPEATKAADAQWTYKFTGWQDAEGNAVTIPDTATANATYTAAFEQDQAVEYTVKFVDGEETVYETKVAWNGEVTLDGFTAPTKEGHSLTWTVNGVAAKFPYAMDTEEVTFVAQWTPNTYTITADDEVYSFTYGTAVTTITEPTKEGHTFAGWLKDGVAYELPATMPAENIVITSNWTVNTYTLTVSSYDAEGKYVEKTIDVSYGDTLSGYYLDHPNYTDDGMLYEFDSWAVWTWSNNDDDTMVVYKGTTMPASDVKMYPTYTMTGWFTDEIGTTYYVKGVQPYYNIWAEIDGAKYWFNGESYIAKDITLIDGSYYAFDHKTGAFLSDLTGIYTASNGDLYYVENGVAVQNKGLVQVEDPDVENGYLYYYFGCGVTGCSAEDCAGAYKAQKANRHWAAITNDYLMECSFDFGEDGVIEHIDDTSYTGIYAIDGVKYYLMDGVKVHKGLIYQDGYYYYARSNGALVVSQSYWVSASKLNGLELKQGTYNFDAEGRIVFATEKNGFYYENDAWYYYEDGALCYAGLRYFDGTNGGDDTWQVGPTVNDPGYYYINSSCKLVTGCDYWISKNNGYMRNMTYSFDDNGTMYNQVVELKEGVYAEDGSLYYYVGGERSYAGLIKYTGGINNADGTVTAGVYNDNYIYVNTHGEVKNNCNYWISKTNDMMPAMSYSFDANGIMTNPYMAEPLPDGEVKNGIVKENGSLYYYENGVLTYAGLIEINGKYYYVRTSGEVVNNCSYWISKNNGLMKNGMYTFDENGVMTNPQPIA